MRHTAPRTKPSKLQQTLSLIYRNRTAVLVEHHPEYSLDVVLELLEERRQSEDTPSVPTFVFLSTRAFSEAGVPSTLSVRKIKLPFLPEFQVVRAKHLFDLPEVP